jgi:ubiquinone/menaquinone biosynthesis C-methylase UbiE
MNSTPADKRYFVSLYNRQIKAKKIESVIQDALQKSAIEDMNMLDIGCGVGLITEYFAEKNKVYCVDVDDNLKVADRSKLVFALVTSSALPFDDNFFDIVISNHVIEHVPDQSMHINEIKRVLKPGGICYLATPNWNYPIEPHYKIPLIHYFPKRLFHGILRLFGKYKEDLFLLSYQEIKRLFQREEMSFVEYTAKVLKYPDQFHLGFNGLRLIPMAILKTLQRCSPTNIFILRKIV